MAKTKTYELEFKYPTEPWKRYDRTRDKSWAALQEERMKKDHPGAEYRIRIV